MFADLHLHTHFSDGTYGPEELAALAQKHSLKAVALTDPNSIQNTAVRPASILDGSCR